MPCTREQVQILDVELNPGGVFHYERPADLDNAMFCAHVAAATPPPLPPPSPCEMDFPTAVCPAGTAAD